MSDATRILSEIEAGDRSAAEKLLPLVQQELRRLAATVRSAQTADQPLQVAALVREAYRRLVDVDRARNWDSRRYFFEAAAEAMRRILVDEARGKAAATGGNDRNDADEDADEESGSPSELLRIDEALQRLSYVDPTAAQVAKLCYFGGLTVEEAAKVLPTSRGAARRHWTYANAWLQAEIKRDD